MKIYKNLSGTSGVTHFETGKNFIKVKFKGEDNIYLYLQSMIGKNHIDKMKSLAEKGRGLSAYISQNAFVRENYFKED